MTGSAHIGLAGSSEAVSKYRQFFDSGSGTGLHRYASTFGFVEVNVSFYRAVRRTTYETWAAQTPDDFAFSVKMSRSVTHFARLSSAAPLSTFWDSVTGLGPKLRAVLVQLPPSLARDDARDAAFFARMREDFAGTIAVEPRHDSWLAADTRELYSEFDLVEVNTQITADAPASGTTYHRLHGEPRRYYSSYSPEQLSELASQIAGATGPSYVVFDNTASRSGVENAMTLRELLNPHPQSGTSG